MSAAFSSFTFPDPSQALTTGAAPSRLPPTPSPKSQSQATFPYRPPKEEGTAYPNSSIGKDAFIQSTQHSNNSNNSNSNNNSNNNDDDDDDEFDISTLPYPQELPRSAFLTADFDPQTYLSTLRNRHQTLEDLRSDLRARSRLLSRELLDLVNTNYEDFLSLGSVLHAGDDKVEGVRVGVLGFRRQVDAVLLVVRERERDVTALLDQKVAVREGLLVGRKLLDIEERLGELEARLMVEPKAPRRLNSSAAAAAAAAAVDVEDELDYYDDDDEEDEGDDDDNDDDDDDEQTRAANALVARLRRHAQLYLLLQHMIEQVGPDHPFIKAQQPRIVRVRNTLLLDMKAALKQAKKDGKPAGPRTLRIASIYRAMGEGEQLISALKGA